MHAQPGGGRLSAGRRSTVLPGPDAVVLTAAENTVRAEQDRAAVHRTRPLRRGGGGVRSART